ncbi:MAG: hypothetical protein Q8P56_06265 [Candidatus Uhrbacteria bacterium]|nr:hypothetical protein [Candidatus Uhrbacteria bacterium]
MELRLYHADIRFYRSSQEYLFVDDRKMLQIRKPLELVGLDVALIPKIMIQPGM